jgi:DNA ligase D-like protein (predicted polymerase)
MAGNEERDGVALTNLDQPLFDGAGATKRDLVDYLDAVHDRIVPALQQRPLSVIRVHRGQEPFMQKNVPKYTPEWVQTVQFWAEASQRQVRYALCNDRRTLVWFANQRAVEYHPALFRVDRPDWPTHLVLDLDPPVENAFALAVRAAAVVRQALDDAGLEGAVKTSGAKGVHIFVPLADGVPTEDAAFAGRALAARAERIDPDLTTTAFIRDDRGGRRHRGRRLQPPGPSGPAGLVPLALERPGRSRPVRLHRAHGDEAPGRAGSVGGADAGAATAECRSGRGRASPADAPGPGHARGQAPRPRPPQRGTGLLGVTTGDVVPGAMGSGDPPMR